MNPFGRTGLWINRRDPVERIVEVARAAESTGYGTVWIAGGGTPGVFDLVEQVLAGTTDVKVATGIVNIWVETPESVTAAWHRLEERFPDRLYVGLGISHARMVNDLPGQAYEKPLARTRDFLDALDEQGDPLPADRRLLAALGPKMCRLAAERTLGTHPYLVTAENTAAARRNVGPDAVVAPELGVVLDADLEAARAQGREHLEYYLGLPNYTNNWRRAGFGDADLENGGSDALLDDVLALGEAEAIAARVAEHRAAGADHVCFQLLGHGDPVTTLTALADV
jgi:probable F420-dependent oxidoreductase